MLTSNTDGLKALHRVLVNARFRAGEGADADELYPILDHAETLLTDILSPEDQTELFQGELETLGSRFPEFAGILSDYQARRL
ncbi:MAG TPA: hypothetical protein VML55_05820 [Planctomycetaceae bacterium]|nr:hypothetical protein [Planctomycetaceae bacterium]